MVEVEITKGVKAVVESGGEAFEIKTQLGPLNIKLSGLQQVISDLTLDLVRGVPKPSPPDESKINGEILFEKQLITLNQSRASVAGYILALLRGYPEVAAAQQESVKVAASREELTR